MSAQIEKLREQLYKGPWHVEQEEPPSLEWQKGKLLPLKNFIQGAVQRKWNLSVSQTKEVLSRIYQEPARLKELPVFEKKIQNIAILSLQFLVYVHAKQDDFTRLQQAYTDANLTTNAFENIRFEKGVAHYRNRQERRELLSIISLQYFTDM